MVHLAPDHQALRPGQNHDCGNEIKIENIGQCYDELEHRSDSGFTSVDEDLWRWEEATKCVVSATAKAICQLGSKAPY